MPANLPPKFKAGRGHCVECGAEAPNRFYCDQHRPAKVNKTKAQRAADKAQATLATPVQVPGQVAAAGLPAGGGKGTVKAPTVDATAKVLGRILMYVTIIIAMGLVARDPTLRTEAEREAQVEQLRLDEDQATKMLHPVARFLTPTKMWSSHGGHLIANADVIDALAALYDYFSGLARYRRERLGRLPVDVTSRPAPSLPPTMPYVPENGQVPEREGRVVSRHDLAGGAQ